MGGTGRIVTFVCCATRPGLIGDAVVHMPQVGFSTSLGLLQRNGADIDKFMDILRGSALYAPTFDKKLQRMLDRDYANPNFPTKVTPTTIECSSIHSSIRPTYVCSDQVLFRQSGYHTVLQCVLVWCESDFRVFDKRC